MERHQHAVVLILSHLGQVWVYASHKPELLTTSMMVSVGNIPPLGMKWYLLPLIAFKFFSRVNIEQQECCVIFCDFSGFGWTFLCINCVFNAFYVHNSNFEVHAHAPVHINWLKNQICVPGCMLISHARNGNENSNNGAPLIAGKRLSCLVFRF